MLKTQQLERVLGELVYVEPPLTMRELEAWYLRAMLKRFRTTRATAAALGIDKTTVYRHLKRTRRSLGGSSPP